MSNHTPVHRTLAAIEGIELLKHGVQALKHGRQGKPHARTFQLSQDEKFLTWEGSRRFSVLPQAQGRSIAIVDVIELLVGQESDVFKRSANAASSSEAHLSLSLVLTRTPAADSDSPKHSPTKSPERTRRAGSEAAATAQRPTLDIGCTDDLQFGFFVASFRALLAESRYATEVSCRLGLGLG